MEPAPVKAGLSPGPSFQPPATGRSTSCVVVRLRRKEQIRLVLSSSLRSDTEVVAVDPTNGFLTFEGEHGSDVFDTEAEALDHLAELDPSFEILERASALLGFAAIGGTGVVLVATRLRTAALLPGGHVLRLVAESRWIRFQLPGFPGAPPTPAEAERLEAMHTFTLNNAHYLCETADVTRPFPSAAPAGEPSWEFVWNRWLASPLRALGLEHHCPHLLQGVVESRVLEDGRGQRYMLALLSRRSRLHPGTRYIARGLNSLASPGNEIECEQLLLTCPPGGGPVRWSSHVWRRGTVPIWWGVELKSGGVGEAAIVVNATAPYQGTRRYFRRLQRRYQPDLLPPRPDESAAESAADLAAESAADPLAAVPITCINLLRCNMQRRDELLLSEHFSEGVRRARKSLGARRLRVLNFDWHGALKELREQATVEGLWALLEGLLPTTDISLGTLEERRGSSAAASASGRADPNADPNGRVTTEWGRDWRVTWRAQQNGVVRFNCADSLDRTNAASYFATVQVLAEQARRLGLDIEHAPPADAVTAAGRGYKPAPAPRDPGGALEISSIHRRVRELMRTQGIPPPLARAAAATAPPPAPAAPEPAAAPPLPTGWEERREAASGRVFYIDHNTKRTTWERPRAPEASGQAAAAAAAGGGSAQPRSRSRSPQPEQPQPPAEREAPAWGLLGLSVGQMRGRLRADLVAAHAETFLVNGDINANLYTASRAMHSAIIGLLQGEHGAVSRAGVGRLANIGVTIQRRWANVLSDAGRQAVLECFLGLRLAEHFPSQKLAYGQEGGLPLGEAPGDLAELPDVGAAPAKTTKEVSPGETAAARADGRLAPPGERQPPAVGEPEGQELAATSGGAAAAGERDPGAFVSPAAPAAGIAAAAKGAAHPLL